MITYIKRKDLEVEKYDACIENSMQSRVYAFSWYLDIVADNWDVLVLDDYKAVMPIPWNRKYGVSYITQPYFCQQLGVFSEVDIPQNFLNDFILSIPSNFIKTNYQFNSHNNIGNRGVVKDNYVLSLDKEYKEIRVKYRKDRKYRINQVRKKNYSIVSPTAKEIIDISDKYYKFIDISNKEFKKIVTLINVSLEKKIGFTLGVINNEGELLGSSFFIKTNTRIMYLFSAVTDEGKKHQVASLILDTVIEKYANEKYILDFEGSMISSISSFYKSFGANLEEYKLYEKSKIPFLFKLFKK